MRGLFIDNLIPREKRQRVRIILEPLNDTKDLLEVSGVIAVPRLRAIKVIALQRRVDIEDHIDASSIEYRCAFIVVQTGREIVHTNSVNAQSLHQCRIS